MELKDPHRVDVTSLQLHESFPRGGFSPTPPCGASIKTELLKFPVAMSNGRASRWGTKRMQGGPLSEVETVRAWTLVEFKGTQEGVESMRCTAKDRPKAVSPI